MSPATRQRVMRSFLAALLQSDLSNNELQEVAEELARGSMMIDLRNLIYETMSRLGSVGHPKPQTERSNDLTEAYKIISSRRFSKKTVMELMKVASPELPSQQLLPLASKTLKEIIAWYLNNASQDERSKFKSIISGKSGDEYLVGLRRKG
jgi:uncharacterized protein YfkK (UPF0435 family)